MSEEHFHPPYVTLRAHPVFLGYEMSGGNCCNDNEMDNADGESRQKGSDGSLSVLLASLITALPVDFLRDGGIQRCVVEETTKKKKRKKEKNDRQKGTEKVCLIGLLCRPPR